MTAPSQDPPELTAKQALRQHIQVRETVVLLFAALPPDPDTQSLEQETVAALGAAEAALWKTLRRLVAMSATREDHA